MNLKFFKTRFKNLSSKSTILYFYIRRWFQINQDVKKMLRTSEKRNKVKLPPHLFNLDLHIGVISDIEQGLKESSIALTRWSISSSNHLLPDRLPVSDPVRYVNARRWCTLNDDLIDQFQKKYKRFLDSFDGFICTYSPVFAELYRGLNKPILIVAATRYETPYTDREVDWNRFNKFLVKGVANSEIIIHANNRGDADYINYFTGLDPTVTPSLCEKLSVKTNFDGPRVIISRDKKLVRYIENQSSYAYRDISTLGQTYIWKDLVKCSEVLIFPQNISTMTLFELATAGVPVAVPSRNWIHELIGEGFQLLGELTFHQLLGLPTTKMPADSPANYTSSLYLDWWIDRADFYNHKLMPNVRIVDSVKQLLKYSRVVNSLESPTQISIRNLEIKESRNQMISDFCEIL